MLYIRFLDNPIASQERVWSVMVFLRHQNDYREHST